MFVFLRSIIYLLLSPQKHTRQVFEWCFFQISRHVDQCQGITVQENDVYWNDRNRPYSSSQSSHHPQEVLLAQFSLYVHKGGLKPDSFHFYFIIDSVTLSVSVPTWGQCIPANRTHRPDVRPMLGRRRRRRAAIGPTSGRCVVFAGIWLCDIKTTEKYYWLCVFITDISLLPSPNEVMFWSCRCVCLYVCPSVGPQAGLLTKYWSDLYETFSRCAAGGLLYISGCFVHRMDITVN